MKLSGLWKTKSPPKPPAIRPEPGHTYGATDDPETAPLPHLRHPSSNPCQIRDGKNRYLQQMRKRGQVMSKARDLINAHLYPVLATFAVIYGAIQIAPIAQQARTFNACMADVPHMPVSIAANLCAGGDG
tara:strand:+ start:831 stop:1220 length:390 start_codon:yes stop_codon:yes gene_type:complete